MFKRQGSPNIILSCGHISSWYDQPLDPGADLPFIGKNVWCNICTKDVEIMNIEPSNYVAIEEILSQDNISQCILKVIYNYIKNSWGFCFIFFDNKRAFETEEKLGYNSFDEAYEEAIKVAKQHNLINKNNI
jgi:hypothetical protein